MCLSPLRWLDGRVGLSGGLGFCTTRSHMCVFVQRPETIHSQEHRGKKIIKSICAVAAAERAQRQRRENEQETGPKNVLYTHWTTSTHEGLFPFARSATATRPATTNADRTRIRRILNLPYILVLYYVSIHRQTEFMGNGAGCV